MTTPHDLERREFLKRLAAGGLVIAVGASGVRRLEAMPAFFAAGDPFQPSVHLHIGEDGLVTIVCHRSEMGQGVRTALCMVMGDELEADWTTIRLEQAIGDPKYGSQNTDGSSSIRGTEYPRLRLAGAAARTMLEQAAAAEWGVPATDVAARNGAVVHVASGRSLPFGQLVSRARLFPVPAAPKLKDASQFRFIGKEVAGLDLHDILTGRAVFGQDAKMPGMKVAVILHPPVYGASVATVDASAALKVKGVERVITLATTPIPSGFQPLGGVAVVASSTWAALQGRRALKVTWTASPNDAHDSVAYRAALQASSRAPGRLVRKQGDVAAALSSAAKKVTAEYYAPHLAQAPMEPPAAVALVTGDTCVCWACTQDPQSARNEVAAALKVPKENVTCHVTLLGGAFGRKSKPDYVVEAALLSREMKAPVKVVWTREDDLQNGFPHTVAFQHLEGSLDATGKVTAWLHRVASPSINTTFAPGVTDLSDGELALGILDLPYAIPNVQAESCKAAAHTRIGWFRSVSNVPHAFAISSFVDELAHAAGRDPRDFILELLGPDRIVDMTKVGAVKPVDNYGDTWEAHPLDTARYRKVVELVTMEAGWGKKLPKGEGLGLAVHRSFLTYVAVVVHAKVGANGEIAIPRVDIAMDCGFVVHPERVRSQAEGAVIMGLSNAMTSELSFKRGRVVQSNFNDYRVLRMSAAPRALHVHLAPSGGLPGGVGEPGVPPVAPALANAIYAATGKRHRSLPLGKA
ncbi:MAG: xanthine dehydrogenase family protein molybdopterin-binding subunit [Gemmatimonadetes bacterium]|nr:xanthine dehydrogenase family protein molybdopterin-binding subunit [Gemmatimonadota bacterium]